MTRMAGTSYTRLLLAAFCLVLAVVGESYNSATVKNPLYNHQECGNNRSALVCDPWDILNQTRVREINRTLYDMMGNHCPCDKCKPGLSGYVFAVVVVPRVQLGNNDEYTAVREFARSIRLKWQLGPCGNDAILVVATEQMRVYVSSGDRLKLHISNMCFEQATEAGSRYFSDRKWGSGILSILEQYSEMVKLGCYTLPIEEYINEMWLYGVLAALSVILVLLIAYTVAKCRTNPSPPKERMP